MPGSSYVVVDGTGEYVSVSSRYNKYFVTNPRAADGKGYLILTVKTGYTNQVDSAAVKINGTTVGAIEPRPWTDHFVIAMEPVIIVFDNVILNPPTYFGFGIYLSYQRLEIVPRVGSTDPRNYLLLGEAICHYQEA